MHNLLQLKALIPHPRRNRGPHGQPRSPVVPLGLGAIEQPTGLRPPQGAPAIPQAEAATFRTV